MKHENKSPWCNICCCVVMFVMCLLNDIPETQAKYQFEWLDSVEATNCRFHDPVGKIFSWDHEHCIEWTQCDGASGDDCEEECTESEHVYEREDYTVYSVVFVHEGVEQIGCACTSDLANKEKSGGHYNSQFFERFDDGT